eukprot:GHVN01064782.1.p2 GENE.GHVN01064782.1~~GHVN01064782.1.p2  ORF type:complete len:103 (-),score=8.41 GHVN01064782.1:237-545(-)
MKHLPLWLCCFLALLAQSSEGSVKNSDEEFLSTADTATPVILESNSCIPDDNWQPATNIEIRFPEFVDLLLYYRDGVSVQVFGPRLHFYRKKDFVSESTGLE